MSLEERLLDEVDAAVVAIGPDQRVRFWNAGATRLYGWTAAEAVGRPARELALASSGGAEADLAAERLLAGERYDGFMAQRRKDGTTFPGYLRAVPVTLSDGGLVAVVVVVDDTERRRAEQRVADAERRYRLLVERLPVVVYSAEAGPGGRWRYVSPRIERLVGYTPEEWTADPAPWAERLHPKDRERVLAEDARPAGDGERSTLEYRLRGRDGRLVWVRDEAVVRHEPGERPVLDGVLTDITEHRLATSQLRFLADHDPLTGLVNRRRFLEELGLELRLLDRREGDATLVVLDLDNFKFVNDTLGHAAGDAVIRFVAATLRERARSTDALARLGGDEFALLLRATGADAAQQVADGLLRGLRSAREGADGPQVHLTASAGVVELRPGMSAEAALAAADLAMYDAKHLGRDRSARWTEKLQAGVAHGHALSDRIREALEHDLFVLHAQPILDLATDDVTQEELLLRLPGADGALIGPHEFLPVAERFDLMPAIDVWVVREAVRLLREEPAYRCLHVNVSGRTIGDRERLEEIEAEVREAALAEGTLVVELTETEAIANMDDAREFAARLRAQGCAVALDDLGSGFGTFRYLKYLPVDYVKIDGDFVRSATSSDLDREVVSALVRLAGSVGAKTIAEFVTDEPTLALVRELGVDLGQGFHIGRPAPLIAAGRRP